jgi:hypothetical protein
VPGPERQVFIEHIELQPIDPQANGPQLFCGLRHHTHIVKPGEIETHRDQVGYWLWEPATGNPYRTLAIPRGQTAMAVRERQRTRRLLTWSRQARPPHDGPAPRR